MRSHWILLLAFFPLFTFSTSARERVSENLSLYASCDPEWAALLASEFQKEFGIKVDWMREGAGVILQRIKAEKGRPQADVWFAGPIDAHAKAAEWGLLESFTPGNRSELRKEFQNPLGNNQSTGAYGGVLGFSVNEALLLKLAKPVPKTWDDLLNPTYKGLISMSNPNTAGTGYTILSTIFRMKGKEQGLEYLKKLDKNIPQYTQSGSAPLLLTGKGEVAIAIVFLQDAAKARVDGYPLKEVTPADGTGYEFGGLSLVKNGPHPELGKKFIEWMLSPKTQELALKAKAFHFPSNQKTPLRENVISFDQIKRIDLPVAWAAENRETFLKLWSEQVFAGR